MKKLLAFVLAGMMILGTACNIHKGTSVSKHFDGSYDLYKYKTSCNEEVMYWLPKEDKNGFTIESIRIEEVDFDSPTMVNRETIIASLIYSAEEDTEIKYLFVDDDSLPHWKKDINGRARTDVLRAGEHVKANLLFGEAKKLKEGRYTFVFLSGDSNVECFCNAYMEGASAEDPGAIAVKKPVIYLYPEEETKVNVKLDLAFALGTTYPHYDPASGWNVIAKPDGTLFNLENGRTYDYLFWEGYTGADLADFGNAACVAGEDTEKFLEKYLTEAGLNDSEIDDFISYWLPQMEKNPYNLISFSTEKYEEQATLEIIPRPDSVLRVFMCFKALEEPVDSCMTSPKPFTRTGFTVVEWGGCEII